MSLVLAAYNAGEGAVDLDDERHRLPQPRPAGLAAHERREGAQGFPAAGRQGGLPGGEPLVLRQPQRLPGILVGLPEFAHHEERAIHRSAAAPSFSILFSNRFRLETHRPGEARRRARPEQQAVHGPPKSSSDGAATSLRPGKLPGVVVARLLLRGRIIGHQASSRRQWRVSPATTVLVSSGTTAMALASDRPCSWTVPGGVVGSAR